MKNLAIQIQKLSLIILGFFTLAIMGAEPGTTESSMYNYDHAFDYGHVGWFLACGWLVVLIIFFTATAIRYYKGINE